MIVWAVEEPAKLSTAMRKALIDPDNDLLVSAVIAWEFADLKARRRLPAIADFAIVCERLSLDVIELPGPLWRIADRLPNIHGDPVDRMLIAHAIHSDLAIMTADASIRAYPVQVVR